MAERPTSDITADLRRIGLVHNKPLDVEAADKLDGLIALLAEAENARDQYEAESKRLGDFANAKVQQLKAARAVRDRIAEAHSKHVDEHGATSGLCNECDWTWPCPTYVWATTDRDPNGPWDPKDDEGDDIG